MFVTEVIPLRRGIGIHTLSYFSSEKYSVGTLLSIPVRSQTILGLVAQVEEVSTAKTALRAATFSLRKLPAQANTQSLTLPYIKTAEDISALYGTQIGNVLFSLLPPEIQRGDIALPHTHEVHAQTAPQPEILQAEKKERHTQYRSIVRETFVHGGSVLIVVPTTIEAVTLRDALMRGIEDRIILLTTSLGKRDLKIAYARLEDFSQAKLIIATPSHAMLERHDIARVILEESRSPHYKERVRPYLDYRDVLRIHAHHTGRSFLMGDLMPRTEDEHLRREDIYGTHGETPKRLEFKSKLELILKADTKEEKVPFSLFTEEAHTLIREVKKKKRHLFIYSARRGLAPIVLCQDCGHIFRSPQSGAPYSLVRTVKGTVEERWFVCGTSGERVRALDVCSQCGSWKLTERGIGIQHVHDELKKIAKDTPIILFDHTTATTLKKAEFLRDMFYDTKGAIMLGTSMATAYLYKEIDDCLIVSLDALLLTPTWRLEEENLALILRLREVTRHAVYLQTKTNEHSLITYAKHSEVERFYTEEIALRKSFQYPPFVRFIHLTWQGPIVEAKKTEEIVLKLLSPFGVTTYQSSQTPTSEIILHGLIRTPANTWPHPPLVLALRALPQHIRVMHDPDKIV
jgi:primosomal protein N' (replication factor Y)